MMLIVLFPYAYVICFFFQAEDGIRDLVRSRGLGDVYKRQLEDGSSRSACSQTTVAKNNSAVVKSGTRGALLGVCLLYTSDAADERSSVDLGGRRIIKKKRRRDNT